MFKLLIVCMHNYDNYGIASSIASYEDKDAADQAYEKIRSSDISANIQATKLY